MIISKGNNEKIQRQMADMQRQVCKKTNMNQCWTQQRQGVPLLMAAILSSLILFGIGVVDAQKSPWQRRIGRDLAIRHKLSYQKVHPGLWPKEPNSPKNIDEDRFREALGILCGRMPKTRLETYTKTILDASRSVSEDPFLLAALMYSQSGCRPKTPEKETQRYGLTRIDINMHAPHIRSGEYRFFLKQNGAWHPQSLLLNGIRFNEWSMKKPVPNLQLAACILSVFKKQCRDLDDTFGGVPHRHYVSHWFFGDRVRHNEPEDAVLTARRRLLHYYHRKGVLLVGKYRQIPLVSPLDGTPRLLLDYFGNKRGIKDSIGHQGIDISGLSGEPVRAVADGKVSFAGVDMKADLPSRQMSPEEAAMIPSSSLGKGGIWITLNHENGFRTCYMHLTSLAVIAGDCVKAGDIIGTLGNSGTTSSGPHLHLEFRVDTGGRADPADYLGAMLVNPFNP